MFGMHCKLVSGAAREYAAPTELHRYLEAVISLNMPALTEIGGRRVQDERPRPCERVIFSLIENGTILGC
jgi:hypothetical protein